MLELLILPLSMILPMDAGTIPTIWYFLVFIFYYFLQYSQSSKEEHKNFLGQMINGSFFDRDEQGIYRRRHLKDEEIVGHINSLIGGGIGTLNACLSFVIHMLAVNPHAQQKAFQEVIKICGYDVSKLNLKIKKRRKYK